MSKTIHDLKKRMKAPRNLVEAVKRGERLEPALRVDTRAVHIRRFTRAIAAYACVAAVLVTGVVVLPMVYGSEQSPLSSRTESTSAPIDPLDDVIVESNRSHMDLSAFALDRYVYTNQENYVRPDLIWANEYNTAVDFPIFSASRMNGKEKCSLLTNVENITGYTFAVDVQLQIIPEGAEKGETAVLKGDEEAKMVESVLGWKPIVAGESYEATCEQLMELNEIELVSAFAQAYEELYGVDAESIPTIWILIDVAWQSCEANS